MTMPARETQQQAVPESIGVGQASARSVQQRLERLLIDDRELLISLQCQLEQIRREMRLLNDERILRALDGSEVPIPN